MVETRNSRRNSENIVDQFENKTGQKRAKTEAEPEYEKMDNPAPSKVIHNPYELKIADEVENIEDKQIIVQF
jgi:hypothetical protein